MTVPYLKFAGPVLDEDTLAGVTDVLRSGQLTSGPWVQRFEGALSAFCAGRPARVVTSATAAVEVALQLCGIGAGDEVITSAQSFFTVLNMIVKVGATPVFVDCDLVTRNIELAAVEAAITPRTKAIVPTHWPGSLVDMEALHALARRRGLRVIEDAALVLGSRWKGQPIGAFGDIVTFSFHPNKNITSIEGGALIVASADEAKRIEALRFHGITYLPDRTRDVAFPGGKFNLPDVNARIGAAQLARLPEFLAHRRALVDRYFERFATDPECVLPPPPAGEDGQSWNMFSVLLPLAGLALTRKAFRDALDARGIGSGVSYEALHLCTLGRSHGYGDGDFPVTERIARETVTLPLHAAMSIADVDRVCAAVAEISRRIGAGADAMTASRPAEVPATAPLVSIVIPVFNEETGLPALFARLYPALDALGVPYEIIFVNDGSRDRSAGLLREQFQRRPDVTRVILFNANYGQHMAIVAGFERCRGERVVTLDADLQNPPEEIGKLLAAMDDGYDYVGSIRLQREDSWWRRAASRAMNGLRERLTRIKMTDQGCMLRAYSREIVAAVAMSREVSTFIPALAYTFAVKPTEVEVAHEERAAGESKYSLYKLIRLNFDLITGFSLVPLQLFSIFGMLVSAASLATYVAVIGYRMLFAQWSEWRGAISLLWDRDILAFFLIGVMLFGMGLIGEYVGRIYEQVRGRPRYTVRAVLERQDGTTETRPAGSR